MRLPRNGRTRLGLSAAALLLSTFPGAFSIADEDWEEILESRKHWWSLQPVADPELPSGSRADRPIDRFVRKKLAAHGLKPAPKADPATLARRLTVALTGLPPTPDQIATPFPELVEELLASPHFGERWARHWMDVVRYTDTYGYEWDVPAKGAWRYRDYLIRAFNDDIPFDQLVREHIAGDLLEEPRIDREEQINESLIGVMFYQMGEKRHGDSAMFDGIHQEMLDNKIDAFSKAFQATTVACARCHDHKLDAVSQRDYYALGGAFMSSRWVVNTLDLPERNANPLARMRALKKEIRHGMARLWLQEIAALSKPQTWSETLAGQEEDLPLEDWRHPWQQLSKRGVDVAATWKSLSERYRTENQKRSEANAGKFTVIADFRDGIPEGWSADGVGLREVVPPGDFTVSPGGDSPVGKLRHGGLWTASLSSKLNGALRTPFLSSFDRKFLSFETSGGDFAAHRIVVDNAFLAERQKFLNNPETKWVQFSAFPELADRRIFLEFATKTSNPNFPPRVGLGGACSEEQAADPRSWFEITRVVAHDEPGAPADELARFLPLFDGDPPGSIEDIANLYKAVCRSAIEAWAKGKATEADVRVINASPLKHPEHPEFADKIAIYRSIESSVGIPQTVMGLADLDPGFDLRLNPRGLYNEFGDPVPRGWLGAFSEEPFHSPGSGRRELADLIASPENPLTARVFVNRVWHWMFGTGIVATPDDFGGLGEKPSHPELLDFLASEFMGTDWKLKGLIRSIVHSETWQQSGTVSAEASETDPANRLLHHFPTRRLEAEAIRDAILAVSGRLDPTLFGPPINPPRSKEDPKKRLFSGPLDGNGRRSIYTKVAIMEPPKFLELFNQPKPKIPTGKRDVTDSPAQALALLNDPFVLEQAAFWAKRLVKEAHASAEERLLAMFLLAFDREPADDEMERWHQAAVDFAKLHQIEENALLASEEVWTDLAHAVFNTKEFIYVR